MWIIPTNHPKYSAYAAACVDSKEASRALLENSMLLLMWKSKPLSFKTLPRLWSRVYWIPRLFGRILKPSRQKRFTESYTASLADIPANHSALPENNKETKTLDTFGRIYSELSKQQTLFGASSKTLKDTCNWDMTKFTEAFEIWVTRLRATYLQRQKLAHHTKEQDFLFSQSEPQNWGTPNTMDMLPERSEEGMEKIMNGARKGRTWPSNLREQVNWKTPTTQETEGGIMKELTGDAKYKLRDQVNWTTPVATDNNRSTQYQQGGTALSLQVKKWPTPASRDYKGSNGDTHFQEKERPHLDQLPNAVLINGHLDPDSTNNHGKPHGLLNPAWVAQLMGTTLEKTFFACTETELLNKPHNSHG